MADAKKQPKKRANKYEQKLKIDGDFNEVLKIATRSPKKKLEDNNSKSKSGNKSDKSQ